VADGDAAPVAADAAAGAGRRADSAGVDDRIDLEAPAEHRVCWAAPMEDPIAGPAAGPEPTKYLH